MGYQDAVLIRDNLGDGGEVPSHGGAYSSPDIICHEQVASASDAFGTKASYAQDLSQPADTGKQSNLVYARAKNTSDEEVTVWLRLYRANMSLFLRPSQWKNNPLATVDGTTAQRVTIPAGGIGVAPQPFVLSGQGKDTFCLVAIANDSAAETVPGDFSNYSDFLSWVHTNPAVGVRNLSLVSGAKTSYEYLCSFSNPENEEKFTGFAVVGEKVPVGTRVVLKCEPLAIDDERTVAEEDPKYGMMGITPAGFDGIVTLSAYLPAGVSKWPDEAKLTVRIYVAVWPGVECYEWAAPAFEVMPGVNAGLLGESGKLVLLGECGVEFVNA